MHRRVARMSSGKHLQSWRATGFLLGLVFAVSPLQGHGKQLYDRPWIEARSPNFVILSAAKEKPTIEMLQELEDFRQVVAIFTNVSLLEPRVPTGTFIFFRDPFKALGLVDLIAGFFQQSMRANYATARLMPGMPSGLIIKHEYTHFLMRNHGGQAYPLWYEEGMAELLSGATIKEGKFDLGKTWAGRLQALVAFGTWTPYQKLIDDDYYPRLTYKEQAQYYPQSWALVHYLAWGKPGFRLVDGMETYLADREAGTPALPAFERAFGENTKQLHRAIKDYLRNARYITGELRQPFDPARIEVRKLASDEVAAAIGWLCLELGRTKEATPFIDAALKVNSRNGRALVARADLHALAGEFEQAEPLYRQAIELEPDSDLHHLDFGEYWLSRAQDTADATERAWLVKNARTQFVLTDKLNDRNPETLAMYGSSFLLEGEDPAKGVEVLEFAHELLPSNTQIKLLLARIYVAAGRRSKARPLLRAIVTWDRKNSASEAAKLLEKIDSDLKENVSSDREANELATANGQVVE